MRNYSLVYDSGKSFFGVFLQETFVNFSFDVSSHRTPLRFVDHVDEPEELDRVLLNTCFKSCAYEPAVGVNKLLDYVNDICNDIAYGNQ